MKILNPDLFQIGLFTTPPAQRVKVFHRTKLKEEIRTTIGVQSDYDPVLISDIWTDQ
jgi:hypothetical protein